MPSKVEEAMRAAVFRQAGQPLVIEQIEEPKPSAHDLILKVRACGICGSDLHMTEPGTMLPLPAGAVMGHEFAGEVVEAGSAVRSEWPLGTAVAGFPYLCCGEASPCRNLSQGLGSGACAHGAGIGLGQRHGAYAEYVRISANGAFRLPTGMSYRAGALVEPLAVGLHAVDMAKLDRNAVILVVGAGPVGLAVILWARFLGIRHVIVSERTTARRAMAARFGASDAINPDEPLSGQVERLAGRGPDVIFECVGAPGMIGQTMA
ncbi:MAG: alcohol dehydrogenase catalytic domain-containing protein, partial [Alphaproteobacteria bacterium]|nr:alcohol dehydrogenase catalytic domain-containing protein [Alphaproteobacteria bacterium]